MLSKIIRTDDDGAALIARLVLALVIFPHGAQKALGWFGGFGAAGTVGFMGTMGIPAALAWLAIAAEFLGSIALVIGFLGRVAAFGILVNMIVATLTVHLPNGFFMNWGGTQAGEGFEFHVLALGLSVPLMFLGGGAYSIDRLIARVLGSQSSTSAALPSATAAE